MRKSQVNVTWFRHSSCVRYGRSSFPLPSSWAALQLGSSFGSTNNARKAVKLWVVCYCDMLYVGLHFKIPWKLQLNKMWQTGCEWNTSVHSLSLVTNRFAQQMYTIVLTNKILYDLILPDRNCLAHVCIEGIDAQDLGPEMVLLCPDCHWHHLSCGTSSPRNFL